MFAFRAQLVNFLMILSAFSLIVHQISSFRCWMNVLMIAAQI